MTKVATIEVFDLDQSSIPNAVLEQIIYRVCNESQLTRYENYTGRENEMQLKTMYASKFVKMAMTILINHYERKEGKVFARPE